jgi:hypothetical protein
VKGLFGLFSRRGKGSGEPGKAGQSQSDQPSADETPTGQIPVLTALESTVEPGGYANSAKPLADGSAPSAEFTIKGNAGSMLFHTKESPYYGRTKAEVWFKSPADAEAAGFTGWNKRSRTSPPLRN